MKLRLAALLFISITLISGCSFVSEVNNTLNYVNEAATFINDAQSFSERFPSLAEEAVLSKEARQTLVNEMDQLRTDIISFNGIDVPAVAKDIHRELIGFNNRLLSEIDTYLSKLNSGIMDPEQLKGTEILDTINQMTSLLQQLEQLGG